MQICGENSQWFAVRTASGREKSVASQLQARGIEEFLPVYRTRRQWSDRTKESELPLFPGYIFCRFDFNRRLPILSTPGVQMIVGVGKLPAPVSDIEIDNLRRVVTSGVAAHPHEQFLTIGERVRIREGSLAGVEGILVDVKNSWRIVLSVELLQRSVSVELDRAAIEPAPAKHVPASRQSAAGRAVPGTLLRRAAG
jgi:transcription antitermination factor NusG